MSTDGKTALDYKEAVIYPLCKIYDSFLQMHSNIANWKGYSASAPDNLKAAYKSHLEKFVPEVKKLFKELTDAQKEILSDKALAAISVADFKFKTLKTALNSAKAAEVGVKFKDFLNKSDISKWKPWPAKLVTMMDDIKTLNERIAALKTAAAKLPQ